MKRIFLNAVTLLAFSFFINYQVTAQTTKTALADYLAKPNPQFQFTVKDSLNHAGLTQYELELTSQEWKGMVWKHRLVILKPSKINSDKALLYIGGGKSENGSPVYRDRDDEIVRNMGKIALQNQSLVALVFQVPNQPIFGGMTEDEIISYTLHQFQETGDLEWPALFPMVKSASTAMDAIVGFSEKSLATPIQSFVLTGASKRGWTTWLTGSQDARVTGIAPMVIDVLNMPTSLQYQIEAWADYSVEIQDYVDLGIPQQASSELGLATMDLVDPYSYRAKLHMPKLIFIGTNDPYWPVDAVKNYIDSIPGQNNLIYIPNVGHDLGDGRVALQALEAFVAYQNAGESLPELLTTISKGDWGLLIIDLKASGQEPSKIELWEAESVEDKDFRDEKFTSKKLKYGGANVISLPSEGQKAFYLAYYFKSPTGKEFYVSSRMYRADKNGLVK
ncbi:PhoPQ-activated pathogenicity-related family protein [Algoriphagus chordae]|uniref:PhoPQ-activated pathogenicity-related protein n=1 Tax=Algoriphagus chordae TaxID=237019 RepID=A0A2W7R5R7_9BACT|nr:PhoPQ-activated protein PqaA family protein [Algoriphagus chordae]PZX55824.1 PhoPQ-activated pathogenicity-related protein [Algoriphagus chordae]